MFSSRLLFSMFLSIIYVLIYGLFLYIKQNVLVFSNREEEVSHL